MHAGVLSSKLYINYTNRNTVEVMCMQDLEKALENADPQTRTYRAKDRYGDAVEYMVKFPGLTVDDVRNLAESDALEYMEGRLMPATVILNPHTLKKMGGINRDVPKTAKAYIRLIEPHVKALQMARGKGIDRSLWNFVEKSQVEIDRLLAEEKIGKAMGVYREMAKRSVRQPDVLKTKVEASLAVILDDAAKQLDAYEKMIQEGKANRVAADLRRLARALADTELGKRTDALVAALKKK